MKKNAFIAILGLAVMVLAANLFTGWFTLSKNDRIAKDTLNKRDMELLPLSGHKS